MTWRFPVCRAPSATDATNAVSFLPLLSRRLQTTEYSCSLVCNREEDDHGYERVKPFEFRGRPLLRPLRVGGRSSSSMLARRELPLRAEPGLKYKKQLAYIKG